MGSWGSWTLAKQRVRGRVVCCLHDGDIVLMTGRFQEYFSHKTWPSSRLGGDVAQEARQRNYTLLVFPDDGQRSCMFNAMRMQGTTGATTAAPAPVRFHDDMAMGGVRAATPTHTPSPDRIMTLAAAAAAVRPAAPLIVVTRPPPLPAAPQSSSLPMWAGAMPPPLPLPGALPQAAAAAAPLPPPPPPGPVESPRSRTPSAGPASSIQGSGDTTRAPPSAAAEPPQPPSPSPVSPAETEDEEVPPPPPAAADDGEATPLIQDSGDAVPPSAAGRKSVSLRRQQEIEVEAAERLGGVLVCMHDDAMMGDQWAERRDAAAHLEKVIEAMLKAAAEQGYGRQWARRSAVRHVRSCRGGVPLIGDLQRVSNGNFNRPGCGKPWHSRRHPQKLVAGHDEDGGPLGIAP